MFTGDSSERWLMKALFMTGYANIPSSEHKHDGLRLRNVYVTSVLRCATPLNKPLTSELRNCSQYLQTELELLEGRIIVIISLGSVAIEKVSVHYGLNGVRFRHGACFHFDWKYLITSYHPSGQYTNAKKLNWETWTAIFRIARSIILNSV